MRARNKRGDVAVREDLADLADKFECLGVESIDGQRSAESGRGVRVATDFSFRDIQNH